VTIGPARVTFSSPQSPQGDDPGDCRVTIRHGQIGRIGCHFWKPSIFALYVGKLPKVPSDLSICPVGPDCPGLC